MAIINPFFEFFSLKYMYIYSTKLFAQSGPGNFLQKIVILGGKKVIAGNRMGISEKLNNSSSLFNNTS